MCGLTGMAWGARSRRPAEREDLLDRFTRLLLFSEHRGPYATGAAWVKGDGTFRVEKAPLPARRFITTAKYTDFLNDIDDDVTVLMGTHAGRHGGVSRTRRTTIRCWRPLGSMGMWR